MNSSNFFMPQMFSAGPQFWPALEKQTGAQRHKFSKVEDELLKSLVEKYGETNWCAIAAEIKNRTPRQCRERYKNYLSPKIKNGPWTREEEELLIKKVAEIGPKWAHISIFFAPRSDVNVKNHWTSMVNRRQREMAAITKKNIAMMIGAPSSMESNQKRTIPPVLPMINMQNMQKQPNFMQMRPTMAMQQQQYNMNMQSFQNQIQNYQTQMQLQAQQNFKTQMKLQAQQSLQNQGKMQNQQNMQPMQNQQNMQNMQNHAEMQGMQSQQSMQPMQSLQNIHPMQNFQNMQQMQNHMDMQGMQQNYQPKNTDYVPMQSFAGAIASSATESEQASGKNSNVTTPIAPEMYEYNAGIDLTKNGTWFDQDLPDFTPVESTYDEFNYDTYSKWI